MLRQRWYILRPRLNAHTSHSHLSHLSFSLRAVHPFCYLLGRVFLYPFPGRLIVFFTIVHVFLRNVGDEWVVWQERKQQQQTNKQHRSAIKPNTSTGPHLLALTWVGVGQQRSNGQQYFGHRQSGTPIVFQYVQTDLPT